MTADCADVKQVLEKVRGMVQQKKPAELSEFEIKELTQRSGKGGVIDDKRPEIDMTEAEWLIEADKVKGIGFERQHMVSTSVKGLKSIEKDGKQMN